MATLDIRQRAGYVFIAVLIAHVILISAQVNSRTGVPMLQALTFGAFAEVQRAAGAAVAGVRGVWDGYVALRGVYRENQELRQRLGVLEVRLQQERALARQSEGLKALLDLRGRAQLDTVAAEVIASAASPDFRTITISKGSADGLGRDMAVVAPAGAVGRLIMPSHRAAKVQLLIDRNAAAGAMIERSRAHGVIMGSGTDRLRLEYVSSSADVRQGDLVVTSGIDGIYPKGFVIGWVEMAVRGRSGYSAIVVRPAVDFTSLEDVLVVTTPAPAATAVAEGTK